MQSSPNGLNANAINANVAASIQQSQSIVVPTLAKSAMDELTQRTSKLSTSNQNPFEGGNSNNGTVPQAIEGRDRNKESLQLVGLIKGFLKRRLEFQPDAQPATVDDVDSHILHLTGKAWPVYWAPVHGQLLNFIKGHSDTFSVINNRHVILVTVQQPIAQSKFTPQTTTTTQYVQNYVPDQNQNWATPQPSYDNYQSPPSRASFDMSHQDMPIQSRASFDMPIPNDNNSSWNDYPTYDISQQYPTAPPQDYINPFEVSQPIDTVYHTSHMQQQYPNVPFPQVAQSPSQQYYQSTPVPPPADDGWALFDNSDLTNVYIPPPQHQQQTSSNPFSPTYDDGFEFSKPSSFSKTRDSEKSAKEKADEARKLQEAKDEELARKLQQEEESAYRAVSGRSWEPVNSVSSNENNRVTLTNTEVRELAETEIGKDNIRIMAGFSVIKFGREGRPHQRKMWINSALTHLAWESSQFDGSHRGLELARVSGIRVGEMTPTIRRSTKDFKKVRNLCFSLESESRTLDIQACSVIQRDSLAAALKKVIEFNHKHKPRRIDKYRTELNL